MASATLPVPLRAPLRIAAAAALPLLACAPAPIEDVDAAVAVLHPTEGHRAAGVVRFEDGGPGEPVRVSSEVSGLSPGVHAYHVHLYGDCSAPDGTSAGTHFNFIGSSEDPPDDIERITGNLGELRADEKGNAEHSAPVPLAVLEGPKGLVGRAVVVHAKGNDPDAPPIGAAGARVACGVIGIAETADTGSG